MHTSISLIRGINVGGRKQVSMEELRRCYESLGFRRIRTYIQSGNVIFEHERLKCQELAESIRRKIADRIGLDVSVVIRTKEEMIEVIKNNPFTGLDESRVHVTFLSTKPAAVPTKEIDQARDSAEKFSVAGREVYLFCPNGYGRTRLSNSFFERKLKTQATTRNWRTVNALYNLANA